MSFDAFNTRVEFNGLLRKLNATLPSIQKVGAYAIRYGSRCGEDLWECIMQQSSQGSINTRINILYFVDSLIDQSIESNAKNLPYLGLLAREVKELVRNVVPDTRDGILNYKSTKQILDSWRTRRLLETELIDAADIALEQRRKEAATSTKRSHETFSKNDIMRRMEEDRERHKRLRERIWILPIPPLASGRSSGTRTSRLGASSGTAVTAGAIQSPAHSSPGTPASPSVRDAPSRSGASTSTSAKAMPPPPVPAPVNAQGRHGREHGGEEASALDVEFEQAWEHAGELGEEDYAGFRDASKAARISVMRGTIAR